MKQLLIKNGRIHDAVKKEPYLSDILIVDGKIQRIAKKITVKNAKVFDAKGLDVYPGWIDAHTHLGVSGYGIGFEGSDYNEMNDIISPQMRGIDSFNPFDPSVHKAALAGITTVASGPGSANVLGGTWLAVKTVGTCVDNMVIKDPVAMKCAFGENPKRVYRYKNNSARMSTAAHLREALSQAKQYLEKKEAAQGDITKMPPFHMKWESLIPVLKKEIPLKAHAHRADDILTAIRIAKEFDLKITLEHVTEGHLIAEQLAKHKEIPLAVGPTLMDATKVETKNLSWSTPGILAKKGCMVSLITDHPFSLQYQLPLYAGNAVRAGMDPFEALKAITIHPAKHLGIEDRVGSIEKGKDGDIVIYEGNPMESRGVLKLVVIDGEIVK